MARNTKNNSQQLEVLDSTPDYMPSEFIKELTDKYGSSEIGWTNINLYRKNSKGEYPWLYKFDTPPEIWEVAELFGGGDYKLYIQWQETGGDRIMRTKKFSIEGPSKMPSAQQTNGQVVVHDQNGQVLHGAGDPEMAFLNKMKLYREATGAQTAGGGQEILIAAMNNMQAIMLKMMERPAESSASSVLLEKLTDKALEKAGESDFDKTMSAAERISKLTGGGGKGEVAEIIEALAPAVIPMLTQGRPLPGTATRPINGTQNAIQRPAAAPNAPGGDMAALAAHLDSMSMAMNENFTRMFTEIGTIKADIKEIQDEVFLPEEEIDQQQDQNNLELVNEQNKNTGVPVLTAEEEQKEMDQAAMVKKMPQALKVTTLKSYIEQYGVDAVYTWCATYKAVKDLKEFNKYMKLAGLPEYVPPKDPAVVN